MPVYVALLRGINLGRRRIKMPALARHFESAGYRDITTVLASGNVIFTSPQRSPAKLVTQLSHHLGTELGYAVPTRVRSAAELRSVLAAVPFDYPREVPSPGSIQVTFFDRSPPPEAAAEWQAQSGPSDTLKVIGRELYWRCTTKLSDSPWWHRTRQNPLKLPDGTTRNLQTLAKIAERFPS